MSLIGQVVRAQVSSNPESDSKTIKEVTIMDKVMKSEVRGNPDAKAARHWEEYIVRDNELNSNGRQLLYTCKPEDLVSI